MSKLKLVREDRNITQIELSIAAEIPRYKVQLLDRGIPCLTQEEAERIAVIVGRHPERLPKWLIALVKEDERWDLY